MKGSLEGEQGDVGGDVGFLPHLLDLGARLAQSHRTDGVDAIASVSTAAISIGAIVADTLGLPFAYVRDTPKDHGLENLIEGNLRPGHKVVMVEDIIATAGGTMKAAEVLSNAGCEVLGGVAIFNYEFPMAVKRLNNANIDMVSLCTYNVMVETALATDYIQPEDVETLKEWRKDPANWVPAAKF